MQESWHDRIYSIIFSIKSEAGPKQIGIRSKFAPHTVICVAVNESIIQKSNPNLVIDQWWQRLWLLQRGRKRRRACGFLHPSCHLHPHPDRQQHNKQHDRYYDRQ